MRSARLYAAARRHAAIALLCLLGCWVDRDGLLDQGGGTPPPAGPPCTTVADCPGDDDPLCGQRSCVGGLCSGNFARMGTECAPGKQCDAVGRCVSCLTSQECAPGVCSDDTQVGGELCLEGECQPLPEPRPCEPYVCASRQHCSTSCVDDTQCAATAYCRSETCLPKKVVGKSCSGAAECLSGFCVDGVCCDTACDGPCESCSGVSGQCTPTPALQDPFAQCAPPLECSGGSQCGTCGTTPVPPHNYPGTDCPAVCSSCEDSICLIQCTAAACVPEIACPEGWDCRIECNDANSCKGATIRCPPAYACTIDCPSGSNCEDATVQCAAAGACSLQCHGGNTCKNLTLACGENSCAVSCTASGGAAFQRTGCPNLCNNCSGPGLCPVTG